MIYNDVKLKSNDDGTFDWDFGITDIIDVYGRERRRSNVIHSIMLQPHELQEQLYTFKGCNLWDYINEPRRGHVLTLLTESIRMTVKEIEGISDATVTLDDTTEYRLGVKIIIFKNDGTEEVITWNSEQSTQ